MLSLCKRYLVWWAVVLAVAFLIIQVSCDLYLPTMTASIIDSGIAKGNLSYIWTQGIKMLGVSFIGIIAAGGNIFFAATQSQKMGRKIRSAMYRKVLYFADQDLDQFGDASLITRSTNDVVQIQYVMISVLRMMFMAPIMLIGAIFLAYTKSPRLTIVFLVALLILAVIVVAIMRYAVPLFRKLQKQTDKINLTFREGLTGVRVIRAFNRDPYEQKRFNQNNLGYRSLGIKVFMLVSLLFPIMTFILDGTNIGIVWFGGKMISHSTLVVGNLVAFMTYSTQILMSFMMLAMIFVFIPRAAASASRIKDVLDVDNSILDPQKSAEQNFSNAELQFKDVNFRYSNDEPMALQNINFHAKAGQTVAIIGSTGSGKSSLINLIPRLYDVTSGEIDVDGTPIKKMTQSELHQHISITQQKAVLFTGTVRSNMKMGNENASDDDIWHALDLAEASEFVKEAGGLGAKVDQNGDNFSGGQKQRLAIARTIIKKASIYIFDDSFSALDFKTDAKLRDKLRHDSLIQKAVLVIVAQRVSTIANADMIIILDHGKIVGRGTNQELKDHNPYYQSILNSQLKKEGK
ncbi:multidrug ABC transporter ATP-binding protein [Philodulcilactobacillus myokoensis]|uniref:Multidrug ABC transporter ATP-binding protein n=1 Tax=Philodulcilactobacillus myokoensis TaxID=2929573 RepID=A0A9W6ET85_9LACO|nr:ABC transporter ATP-binding protein [Philodulcilactobacillus myokoensis]GLB47093.1 multidrug ABC transporter ATP-binding protein [Philodulcilactobacillus myokoensis]